METVHALYAGIEAPIIKTDVTSAEMIKIASNAFLVTKISFISEIAALCERVGGRIDDVTQGLALDPRIGPAFLGAGIGWGGSCFPKDARALEFLASANGSRFDLLQAVISVNDRQRLLPLQALRDVFGDLRDLPVAILGLTFKPGTDDLREAPAISLATALAQERAQVFAYDPVATERARSLLPENVRLLTDPLEALEGARAAVLTTEWPEVVNLPWARAVDLMKPPCFVFDGRNALDQEKMTGLGFQYRGVGRVPQSNA
jgi:UDPglucose 6-dehydrogenase